MATSRLVSKSLSTSKRWNRLSSWFTKALYMLLIVHSDDYGVIDGDAEEIKWKVLPAVPNDPKEIEKALEEMRQAGLIHRYSWQGHSLTEIIQFDSHQQGLHKRTSRKFPEYQAAQGETGNSGRGGNGFPEIPGNNGNDQEDSGVSSSRARADRDRDKDKDIDRNVDTILSYPDPQTEKAVDSPEPSQPASEDILHSADELEALYNQILGGILPRSTKLSKGRRDKANSRLKENNSRAYWQEVFTKAGESSWLTGRSKKNSDWKANFDWIMANDTRYVSIYEGAYADRGGYSGGGKKPVDWENEPWSL